MQNIVIGIEGLVGAGKTSICRELLNRVPNSILLHGGNLYRTIVYMMLKNRDTTEKDKEVLNIKDIMDKYKIEIKIENRETVFYVDGEKVDEEKIQSEASSLAVSEVGQKADNTKLFKFAKEFIENIKLKYDVIVSGRAIMQIYPEIDYHFFVTATLEERVKRKCIQYNKENSQKEVEENIIRRDELQRRAGFYNLSPNTITVDVTNCKTAEEGAYCVLEHISEEDLCHTKM